MEPVQTGPFKIAPDVLEFLHEMATDDLTDFSTVYRDSASEHDAELFIFCNYVLFKRTGSSDHLQVAIDGAQDLAQSTPHEHPDRSRRIAICTHLESTQRAVSTTVSPQSRNTLNLDSLVESVVSGIDLDSAEGIGRSIRMLEGLPTSGVDPTSTWILAYLHVLLAKKTKDAKHIDSAIVSSERALCNDAIETEKLAFLFQNLRALYCERHVQRKDPEDLGRAIGAAEMVVALMPSDDGATKANELYLLARLIDQRRLVVKAEETDDIDQAISAMENALALSQSRDEGCGERCHFLAKLQRERFEATMADGDLDLAVQRFEEALEVTIDLGTQLRCISGLARFHRERFRRKQSVQDLARPVELAEILLSTLPQDLVSEARVSLLHELEASLRYQYDHDPKSECMDRAIDVLRTALNIDSDSARWNDYYNLLGGWFRRRFGAIGEMEDLNRSIEAIGKAVDLNPQSDRNITNWAGVLAERFEHSGNRNDLELAIDATEKALNAKSQDNPTRYINLVNLSGLLSTRATHYSRDTGETDSDWDRCVKLAQDAVDCSPPDGAARVSCMTNYSNQLQFMYHHTHSSTYLDRAAQVAKSALEQTPPDYDDLDVLLTNVALIRMKQKSKTQMWSAEDLDTVGDHLERALLAVYQTHPRRARILGKLAMFLMTRSSYVNGDLCRADLRRARTLLEEALELLRSENHTYQFECLSFLSFLSRQLFRETGDTDELDRMLHFGQIALQKISPDHGKWAQICWSTAEDLRMRDGPGDRASALDLLRQGWSATNSTLLERVLCAREAAEIHASQSNWAEARFWLENAVEMLPRLTPRSLKANDQEFLLGKFSGLACQAASAALTAVSQPYEALRSLEVGRGVIAGLLMEVRIDVSDLENEEPALASRFLSLRDTLDTTFEEPSGELMSVESPLQTWRREPRGRREMDAELRQVIDRIRTLPGFERFLLPPSAEECMAAADLVGGPIVAINVSRYRCDAMLIERNLVRSLRLDRLHESEIDDKVRAMKRFGIDLPILEWLWDVAAGPILSELGFHTPPANEDWPHIWWILTGPLSHLPIHAAGYHGNWSSDNVLDRVMSSYTSSIKALVHSRRNKTQQQPTTPLGTGGSGQGKSTDQGAYPHHALLVAMPDTAGTLTSLPYACKEVEMIEGICLSMNLQPIRPPARRSEVLQEMRACQIFHFAGHGQSQPQEPSESRILLDDWMTDPLTVADFRSFRFGKNPPFLAFLSACLTSVNDADDLVDEGIHLSGAFHLAGFRNVVGTLWEVSDLHCVDVARIVYETLRDIGMTDYAICLGLHHAVRALRDRTIGKSHSKNKVNSSFQGGIVPTVTTSGETEAPKTQIDHVRSAEEVHKGSKGDRAWRPAKLLTPMTWQTSTQEHPRYWAPYIHFG